MIPGTTFAYTITIMRSLLLAALALAVAPLAIGCNAPAESESEGSQVGDEGGSIYDRPDELVVSRDAKKFIDVPFYFAVPESAYAADTAALKRAGAPFLRAQVAGLEDEKIGLRVLALPKEGRGATTQNLAKQGVLQEGDVILSFRLGWAGTMAYPHIQMGTSHAGLMVSDGTKAFNLDMPLGEEYNKAGLTSALDAKHYEEADSLHVVRPLGFDDAHKKNLRAWFGELRKSVSGIRDRGQLPFNSDYLKPLEASTGKTPRQTVTTLGRIVQGADKATVLKMYCSEFAWHMLALSGCTPQEITSAGPEGAACVTDTFVKMPLLQAGGVAGLTEGPLKVIQSLSPAVTTEARVGLMGQVFANGNPTALSTGHAAVAEQVKPLISVLQPFYAIKITGERTATFAGQTMTAEQVAGAANAQAPTNYSPTAFLVNSMLEGPQRKFEYVTTLAYADTAGLARAKQVAALSPGR